MSDNEISPQALARKQRFAQAKEDAGGVVNLIDKIKTRPYKIYFNEYGEIVYFSQEDVEPNENWLTHDFTQDQLKILIGKELSKYIVKIDEKVDNLYNIEVKTIETIYTDQEKDFLAEIEYNKAAKYDVKVVITAENTLDVSLSNSAKEPYKDLYPISATVKGQRLLKFFITQEGDPHIMYHYEIISLAELITESKVSRQLPADLRHCSVYTVKLFDKYQRN